MTHHLPITRNGIPPEVTRPDSAVVTEGDPVHTTWSVEERGPLFCGLWQSTPGTWRLDYTEWEYIRILSGVSILTEDGQPPVTLRAGDSHIIRPGFRGTWTVIETTLKDYVIVT